MGAFLSPNPEYSWEVVRSLTTFKNRFSGMRFLYGVSRKSFIKNLVPAGDLDFASKLAEFELLNQGVDIIRTHNVKMFRDLMPIEMELVQ